MYIIEHKCTTSDMQYYYSAFVYVTVWFAAVFGINSANNEVRKL